MLSASEASAFNAEIKQILRRCLRMTFKEMVRGIQSFPKEHAKGTNVGKRVGKFFLSVVIVVPHT
jgi:hypothetical protein